MIHATSESDMTSLARSSPGVSPKPGQQVYYVQSPSRDSHEDDTSASASATQATSTPVGYRSPSESPSLLSLFGRSSSESRISGAHGHGYGFRRKGRREMRVERRLLGHVSEGVDEGKESYRDMYLNLNWWRDENEQLLSTSCKGFIGVILLGLVFVAVCFLVWAASTPFAAHLHLKGMMVNNFYYGEGSDLTGVPTKTLTVNCSLRMRVHNPATFFGIHVSCSTLNLRYYGLTIASGQMETYYQPKKSWKTVQVNIQGRNVPLYGAGAGFEFSDGVGIPLILEFEMRSQGNVVGMLVKTKHRQLITCSFTISSRTSRVVDFPAHSCQHR